MYRYPQLPKILDFIYAMTAQFQIHFFYKNRIPCMQVPTLQCKTTKFEGLVYSVKLDQIELKMLWEVIKNVKLIN